MSKFYSLRAVLTVCLFLTLCGFGSNTTAYADSPKQAKNVILFIGDGMGFNSDVAGTLWRYGEEDAQSYHKFPVKLGAATFCVHKHSNGVVEWNGETDKGYVPEEFWKGPDGAQYRHTNTETTDSGASATAINTGYKTRGGRINYSMKDERLRNFADMNYEAGRSVGVLSTNQISHATPAGASAHNVNRGAYEEISKEQINDLPLTVLMGCGHPCYDNGKKIEKDANDLNYQFVGGREVWEKVSANDGYKGWSFIDSKEDFAKLADETPDKGAKLPKKLLGVVRSNGDMAPVDGGDDEFNEKRFTKTQLENIPTLAQMTLGALNVLAQNDKGFYLMVEGGSIDHANHGNNVANMVLEHTGFTKAIDAAVDWVEKYSSWDETIMIITADHETGQIWGAGTYDDNDDNGKFKAKDDTFNELMPIEQSDADVVPDVQYLTTGHSNSLVPVYVKGVGSESASQFIRGNDEKAGEFWGFSGDFIYNSDVFNIMSAASGLK